MKRRKLLKKSLLLGSAGLLAGGGVWLFNGTDKTKLTIAYCQKQLQQLNPSRIKVVGEWNFSEVFNHLAQSIEFSMFGYPQHKSDNFKKYIGSNAFAVFSYRGKMSHNLAEPIPGAASLDARDPLLALSRLVDALNDFRIYKGELKPHFAYGELSHQQYTWAHVMHVNNHLESLELSI